MTTSVVRLLDPFTGFGADEISADIAELIDYFTELADQRRTDPRDDLITALVQAEEDGDRLNHDELMAMIGILMAAGHETTTGLLGNAIIALAQNPEQRSMLRDQPDLWPNAVEELIRFDSSVQADPRAAIRDVKIGDQEIKAGDNVLLMLGAINRDPRRYDNPNQLMLNRPDPRPISFGHGIHHCIGASLARMELRLGLQAVLDGFGDYTVDLAEVEWKQSVSLRGPIKLPVHPIRQLGGSSNLAAA